MTKFTNSLDAIPIRMGKDEMNFVENPIAILTDRPNRDVKTLKFIRHIEDHGCVVESNWIITGSELVVNPSFEGPPQWAGQLIAGGKAPWWTMDTEGWDRVFFQDELWGGCGDWYAKINTDPSRKGCPRNAGVFQQVIVNQTIAKPLVASAWSIGTSINGTHGADYSLYADVQYIDGTYSYGHYVPFDLNVTLWQYKAMLIQPTQPINSVYLYGLFRGDFVGVVYFDSFSLKEATVASPNLILNPSFDNGSPSNCSAPIPHWTNLVAGNPYIHCPEPDTWLINSPPGFIGTPGFLGLSGAKQRVNLAQTTPREIKFQVYARVTETTVGGAHIQESDARLVVTYTDGTTQTLQTNVRDTTQVVLYTIDLVPTKPIDHVVVELRFNDIGYDGCEVTWDDASLVQF